MNTNHQVMVDVCAKFFKYLRIEGWCASNFSHDCDDDRVVEITLDTDLVYEFEVELPSPGIGHGLNKKFVIDIKLKNDFFPEFFIHFKFKNGVQISKSLMDLRNERISRYSSLGAMPKFKSLIKSGSLLDIGGRARSRVDRSSEFQNDVVVLDVLDGENVDVVGDAHSLSLYFPGNHFDASMSIFVFEHLAMPWKVVLEINKVLKYGGYCLIYTHQTIGLHDLPWDFYRFSEDCWPTLFNKSTGFEIIERGSDFEQFIIPFIWPPGKTNAELSAGREASWCIAKKISDSNLHWPVSVSDILVTNYPDTEDGSYDFRIF